MERVDSDAVRTWLAEIARRLEKGEKVDYIKLRIEMRNRLPRDFNHRAIDNRLFDNGRLTTAGLFLVNPNAPLLGQLERAIVWIRDRLLDDLDRRIIAASEVAVGIDVDLKTAETLLWLLCSMHGMHAGYRPSADALGVNEVLYENEGAILSLVEFRSIEDYVKQVLAPPESRSASALSIEQDVFAPSVGGARELQTAFGRYRVQQLVGQGGAGEVYEVVDEDGEHLAAKILRHGLDTTKRKRFVNEMAFCQQAVHPNIVRVLATGVMQEHGVLRPFYVMRHYPRTLRSLIGTNVPSRAKLRVFGKVLGGVAAAHLKEVVHRDIKPENILMDQSGDEVVVSDFGIAHFTEDALATPVETGPAERLANYVYAAPEQRRRGGVIDRRSDIYALGMILNELFTGEPPLGANYKCIRDVSKSNSYLDEVVSRMISQDMARRPSSIEDVKHLLMVHRNEFLARQRETSSDGDAVAATAPDELFEGGDQENEGREAKQTVVSIDVSTYSRFSKNLSVLDARSLRHFNVLVHDLFRRALEHVAPESANVPFADSGDGAIFVFESAKAAVAFAEKAQHLVAEINRDKVEVSRVFLRVGIRTGQIWLQVDSTNRLKRMAGMTIADAVRIQNACAPGEVMICLDTWAELPKDDAERRPSSRDTPGEAIRSAYGKAESVLGKSHEKREIEARRRRIAQTP